MTGAAPRATAAAPRATPAVDPQVPPPLIGVPPLGHGPSPTGCAFGSACGFQDAKNMTLKNCALCGSAAHHLCCIEHPLIKDFAGELPGCSTYCFPCAAFLGVASGETDGAQLQPYYRQINWELAQQQSPLTLGARLSWRPRPILAVHPACNSI